MITELVMGIDSIVIKPSIQDSDIPAGTVSEASVFSLQDELIFNGGGATLGIQKSEGIFRLDLADFHSELKLPFWQDELKFSGRLSGTSLSWNTEDLSLSTTELTSKLQISKSLTKYDLELQSLELLPLFYDGLAPIILPTAALESIEKYLVYINRIHRRHFI